MSTPIFDFPLRGTWKAIRSFGHHRYAYDFACSNNGRLFSASHLTLVFGSAPVEDSYSWGKTVYAPADGRVVVAHNEVVDTPMLNLVQGFARVLHRSFLQANKVKEDIGFFAGNHLVIEANGVFILLAHLRRDSLLVSAGATVSRGDQLASVGNSGNSVAPHLHFQANAGADLLTSEIVDFGFSQYAIIEDGSRIQQTATRPEKGQTIEIAHD